MSTDVLPAIEALALAPRPAARRGSGPLNILVTVNAAWNIWNFRRPVIAALIAEGHRVTVLAPKDETVPCLERMGCRFAELKMDQQGLDPRHDLALLLQFYRTFRALRPDIILGYTIKNNIYGAMAAQALGLRFIPNVSGLGTAFLSGGLLRRIAERLYRWSFGRLPVVFFQNDEDRAHFVRRKLIRPWQARVLPGSGIDPRHFAPAPYPLAAVPPTFLMIGRLLRDKGVHEFVEAAQRVRARYPQARFQLLGAVDAKNRTAIDRATVAGWERAFGIEYLGTCDDVREHIAKAHCVVLPSYREGAPRTLIEAAAMARPLIASDVPGCRTVVEHGRTGFLCEERSGESLAGACLRFLETPREKQMALGRAGCAKMQREFDQAIVVRAYRQAIADILACSVSSLRAAAA